MIPELPRHDLEAEQSLIASIIFNNALIEDCSELIPDDFYNSINKLLFDTILKMISSGKVVDASTIWFETKETIEPEYISKLLECSALYFTKDYSRIVKECSITRQIKTECGRILESKIVGEDLLSEAQTCLLKIQSTKKQDDIKKLKRIILSHVDRLEKSNTTKEGRYYKLGFPRIDRCLKTIGPKLIIIAGRPGMGKTAFAVTASLNLDRAGVKVCFLSIEMPETEIIDRWLSIESGVDSSKFGKYKGFEGNDFRDVNDAASVLYDSDIKIDGSGSLDIVDVERKCRKAVKDGSQVVFIDQLSQIGNRQVKGGEHTTLFTENCTRLARLKKELSVPIFLLCQLNRDMKSRSNKIPILSDLKQSGKIEEDADAVIFIHRPEEYTEDEAKKELAKGKAIIDLAKNRSGPKFRDNNIRFVHETTYFYQE